MSLIEEIRAKLAAGEFELSVHASDQSLARGIRVWEIVDVLGTGEIIEDYPNDKYGPSCLVFGTTELGRPLHVHCSYPFRALLRIITAYVPDPVRWVDLRHRKGRTT